MEKVKLVLVIEGGYPWHRGGVSEWVYQYVRYSEHINVAILQIVSDRFADKPLSEALYNIPGNVTSFTRISVPSIRKNWKQETCQWLEGISKNVEPIFNTCDMVHITNTGFAGWLGMQMALAWNKPLVLTEHALYWKEVQLGAISLESGTKLPQSDSIQSLFVEMLGTMARQIYQSADHIISVSRCNIPQQKMLGAKNVNYIPNGIDNEWLLDTEKKREKNLTIGWIGRCAYMKNPLKFFDLIDAFDAMEEFEVSFLMLSCDANEPALEQRLKAKCEEYPKLKLVWNQPTKEFIDQMDTLCITSHNESQPLVLFEALARKVLPVGWQTGDADSRYGIFIPQDQSASYLLDQILTKWRYPEEWKREVNKRYQLVAHDHLWETVFKRYHRLLKMMKRGNVYAE